MRRALAAVAVAAILAPAPAIAADGQFAQTYMRPGRVSTATAAAYARGRQVVIVSAKDARGQVAAMKRAQPGVHVLFYLNTSFVGSPKATTDEAVYAHSDCAHPDAAHRIYRAETRFPNGSPLRDVNSYPAFYDLVHLTRSQMALGPYDGPYHDQTGQAPALGIGVSARPCNPKTGRLYTPAEWLAGAVWFASHDDAAVHASYALANGDHNGESYVDGGLYRIGDAVGASLAQSGSCSDERPPTEAQAYADARMLDYPGHPQPVAWKVQTWGMTPAEAQACEAMAGAIFLVGSGGSSGNDLWLLSRNSADGVTYDRHLDQWMAALGPAAGPLEYREHKIYRAFAHFWLVYDALSHMTEWVAR